MGVAAATDRMLDSRSRAAFGVLIAAQAAHSVEEYAFRLFDVFSPARFVAGLVSSNLPLGFAVANIALVLFGLWCYLARVRPGRRSGRAFAWFWVVLEFLNGLGHIFFSLTNQSYFPGVATAPVLLGISSYLGAKLFTGL